MERIQATVRIKGRVQGVFFRDSAKLAAGRLGVTGWIRNCSDGDVEARVEGSRERVAAFIAWCNVGPSHAKVEQVDVQESAATGEFSSFRVEYS